MKKLIALVLVLVCVLGLAGCYASDTNNCISQTTDTAEENIDTDILVCTRIDLSYCGNKDNSISIEDDGVCSDLMAFISKANGTQEGSSKGYYGVPYTLTIYFDGVEDPLVFMLWNEMQYSTSEHIDGEGYPYLFSDDLSDMWQYLVAKYPDEFWYADIAADSAQIYEANSNLSN